MISSAANALTRTIVTYLLQIPRLQRIRLESIIRKVRAKLVHLANLLTRSAGYVLVQILDRRLLVTRLHTSHVAPGLDPVRPGQPLAGSHER